MDSTGFRHTLSNLSVFQPTFDYAALIPKVSEMIPPTLTCEYIESLLPAHGSIRLMSELVGKQEGTFAHVALRQAGEYFGAYENFSSRLFGDLTHATDTEATLGIAAFHTAGTILDNHMAHVRTLAEIHLPEASQYQSPEFKPNVYEWLFTETRQRRNEFRDLDYIEIEGEFQQTTPVQISAVAKRIIDLRRSIITHAYRLNGGSVFIPTPETEYASGLLFQLVQTEDDIKLLINAIYKYIYESSGKGKQISKVVGDKHPVVIEIKLFRSHYDAHDMYRQGDAIVRRNQMEMGKLLRDACGSVSPSSPNQWQRVQFWFLNRVETLLRDMKSKLAT
jgi:hypothetical protein